jgi:hypothetical protein
LRQILELPLGRDPSVHGGKAVGAGAELVAALRLGDGCPDRDRRVPKELIDVRRDEVFHVTGHLGDL